MRSQIPWQTDWPGAIHSLEIDTERVGLIVVDVQLSCADPDQTPIRSLRDEQPALWAAWVERIERELIPNTQRLIAAARRRGWPVLFLRVGSLLPDAEDQHARRRESWMRLAPDAPPYRSPVGSPDYEIRPEIAPLAGDLVIDKNTSGAFHGSGLDYYLHALGLQTLMVCGLATSACVDATARDAADRGYNVILVEDACSGAAGPDDAHQATLRTFSRYLGAVKTTDEVLTDLAALEPAPHATASAGR